MEGDTIHDLLMELSRPPAAPTPGDVMFDAGSGNTSVRTGDGGWVVIEAGRADPPRQEERTDITICDYCGSRYHRSMVEDHWQRYGNANCVGCGAPLPLD